MSDDVVIKLENVSKQYRLGEFGTGTLSHDLNRWWHRVRGKEDPYLKIGAVNDRASRSKDDYVWALKDINLEVKQGEVLGIIGKNGAGKSTLLKLLSRVTGPTTGKIQAKGRVASLLEVGTGFHPELTGKENIYLNGAILGMNKAEVKSKLDEIVDFAGIARYLDTPVKRYSSGMKVRLGFAVAAHLEPEILIVDEVLAVGDASFQKKAIRRIKKVSGTEGRTILFVSHNMASVENICSTSILLKNGVIEKKGESSEIIRYYIEEGTKNELSGLNNYKKENSDFIITELFFCTHNGRKIKTLKTGENIECWIKCISKNEIKEGFCFSIGFFTMHEVLLFSCRNDAVGSELKIIKGETWLKCKIPHFPLKKGEYKLNIAAYVNSEILASIKSAKILTVESGDYYGTGIIPASTLGGVCINYNWETVIGTG